MKISENKFNDQLSVMKGGTEKLQKTKLMSIKLYVT